MFFLIFSEVFFIDKKLEIDAKMEVFVTVFAVVGSHISLKVLLMKLLFRR